MSMHPTIAAALADQHRRDMITRAEAHRAARACRPAHAHRMRIFPQLIAAARRPVKGRLLLKVPAARP